MKLYKVFLFLSLFMVSCDRTISITKELELQNDDSSVKLKFSKMRIRETNGKHTYFIYGTILIENTSKKPIKYLLSDYYLKLKSSLITRKLYIDSVASILISEKELEVKKFTENKVYWVFEEVVGENISVSDINEIQLCKK